MKGFALLLVLTSWTFGLTVDSGSPKRGRVPQIEGRENTESANTESSNTKSANSDSEKPLPAVGESRSSMPPEEVASSFYRWYLHALYQTPTADPFRANKAVVEQYCTARLLQKLANSRRTSAAEKGPDADTVYFFGTLDLSSEWERNIAASTPVMKGVAAVVHITFRGTAQNRGRLDVEQERKVVLVEAGGLWKIDDVGIWP